MSRFKVLVVDDEPFICRSLSFVLRKGSYEVIQARDGQEALEMISRERPDLVFLDVMMPKISGFDVTRQVKADPDLRATKIVLLTAKGQDSDRQTGEEAGADAYMTKPFSPTKILERARALLQG
jgi:DNA-binding response OmpR family regulator